MIPFCCFDFKPRIQLVKLWEEMVSFRFVLVALNEMHLCYRTETVLQES